MDTHIHTLQVREIESESVNEGGILVTMLL
jgi:hypothetical protein